MYGKYIYFFLRRARIQKRNYITHEKYFLPTYTCDQKRGSRGAVINETFIIFTDH